MGLLKLGAALAPAIVAAQSAQLIMLPDSANADAVCLDGTPYGVYFYPGSGDGANKWLVYFQGGGWCYDEMDCYGRSKTALGSSTKWGATMGGGGLLSLDPKVNNATATWNHVLLPYCDGNSFSGFRDSPLVVNGEPLHMRGHSIVTYVMEQVLPQNLIKAPTAWTAATDVLLTGCSAGGLSTYLHANYVQSVLPSSVSNYRVAPISGFFLDMDNVAGTAVYAEEMKNVFYMQNASAGVDQNCVAAHSTETAWMCNMAPHVFPYIQAPIFGLNSIYDSWQTGCVLTPEFVAGFPNQTVTNNGNCSAVPGWNACAGDPEKCTNDQMPEYNGFRTKLVTAFSTTGTANKPGNGAFLTSCHTHCEAQSDGAWTSFSIGGVTMGQAFEAWMASPATDPAAAHTYTDCTLNAGTSPRACNPSCGAAKVSASDLLF